MVDASNPQQQTVKDGGVMIPSELYATLPRAFQIGWESLSGPQQQQIVVRASHSIRVNNNEEEENAAQEDGQAERIVLVIETDTATDPDEDDAAHANAVWSHSLLTNTEEEEEQQQQQQQQQQQEEEEEDNAHDAPRRPRVDSSAGDEEDDYDITARALLTKKGFDPEDLNKRNRNGSTPMIYFSSRGNLSMVRYLLSRGADCRATDSNVWYPGWFPLVWAAAGGHLEIVRFLSHDGGAHDDIRRVTSEGYSALRPFGTSPLRVALLKGHFHVAQWLTLNGALSSPRDDVDGGGIDDEIMRRELRQIPGISLADDKRLPLLLWAQDIVTDHDNFQSCLTSTSFTFNGKQLPGELELIAQFVAGTPQQLHTLRQLIDRLGEFIDDVRFVIRGEEDEDADEEDE